MKPRRSSKRCNLLIYRRKIKHGVKEDIISSLPDCLLVEIISRLPTTKHAIRTTCTLSKRWQHLWTLLPNLVFVGYDDLTDRSFATDYFSFIDETLMKCHTTNMDLNMFKCNICYNSQVNVEVKAQFISWIRYAISRNVREVDLQLCDIGTVSDFRFADELFFNNSCFTRVKVDRCVFGPPLDGVISWSKLKCLCISRGNLDEDMIGKILSGSPCLETLELNECYGYKRIDITSKSVKNLVFSEYNSEYEHFVSVDYIDRIEINAPYISSLTIQEDMALRELLLLNVSSLVNVKLDYSILKKFGLSQEDVEEDLLGGLLQSLGHVNKITLGDSCLEVLSRLEDECFQFFEGTDEDVTSSGSDSEDEGFHTAAAGSDLEDDGFQDVTSTGCDSSNRD
ncbi:ribonuclease H-like domain-containing protein [Tanacetum coccineum]